MNRRLVVVMILCGMLMQFLPLLIKLGIFFLLFIYLFTTWDEYRYQCSVREDNLILVKKECVYKMNRRLVVVMILCGMLMQFLPLLIKLGIFFLLFIYLFTTWDEYRYQYSVRERKVKNVQK
ncbi:hypothetical protein IGI95_002666 [Enterococcus sp. DIV0784]